MSTPLQQQQARYQQTRQKGYYATQAYQSFLLQKYLGNKQAQQQHPEGAETETELPFEPLGDGASRRAEIPISYRSVSTGPRTSALQELVLYSKGSLVEDSDLQRLVQYSHGLSPLQRLTIRGMTEPRTETIVVAKRPSTEELMFESHGLKGVVALSLGEPIPATEEYKSKVASGIERVGVGKADLLGFVPSLPEMSQSWSFIPSKGVAETLVDVKVSPLLVHLGLPTKPSVVPSDRQVRPFAFTAGVVASGESFVYAGGQLLGYRTPQIPATMLSFQMGKALSYGPDYVAGTLLADVAVGYGIGVGAEKVFPGLTKQLAGYVSRVTGRFGPKVTAYEIVGAEEMERASVSPVEGGVSERIQRATWLDIGTEKFPVKYVGRLEEFSRYIEPETVVFGGTEKVAYRTGQGELVAGFRGTESVGRIAEPYVEAVQRFVSKGEKPVVFQEMVAVRAGETFPASTRLSLREFSGVEVTGKIDPQVYLRFVKAVGPEVAEKWYPQMGGLTLEQLEKSPNAVTVLVRGVAFEPAISRSMFGSFAAGFIGQELVKGKSGESAFRSEKMFQGPKRMPSRLSFASAFGVSSRTFLGMSPFEVGDVGEATTFMVGTRTGLGLQEWLGTPQLSMSSMFALTSHVQRPTFPGEFIPRRPKRQRKGKAFLYKTTKLWPIATGEELLFGRRHR